MDSVDNVKKKIDEIRKLDLQKTPFSVIRKSIEELFKKYRPLTFSGRNKSMYRARINKNGEVFNHVCELWYPPFYKLKELGRANVKGESVFYCSSDVKTAVKEIKPKNGDKITVMQCCWKNWEDKYKITVLGLGFPDVSTFIEHNNIEKIENLEEYRKKKIADDFKDKGVNADKELIAIFFSICEFLDKEFRKKVNEKSESHKYAITAATADCIKKISYNNGRKVKGFCYPSVEGNLKGFNYAFTAEATDAFLEPKRFFECEVVNIKKGDFVIGESMGG